MSRPSFAPPPLDPYGFGFATGPGPLSPAWPEAVASAHPGDEFLALADELSALRRACLRSLDPDAGTGPLLLGRDERVRLNAVLVELKAVNAALPHNRRSTVAPRWPDPVLPEGVLFGPRDLLSLFDTAASVARQAAEERRWKKEWAKWVAASGGEVGMVG